MPHDALARRPIWYQPVGDLATSDAPPTPMYDTSGLGTVRPCHVALTHLDPTTGEAHDIDLATFRKRRGVFVSTVFLYMDHAWMPDEPPVLWESLAFNGKQPLSQMQQRYTSRHAAIGGHDLLVRHLTDCIKRGVPITPDLDPPEWED